MNGSITISRRSDEKIYVTLRDKASRAQFVVAEITCEDFAMALTGLSEVPVKLSVEKLEVVGKQKVTETREMYVPGSHYDRKWLENYLIEAGQEDGWILDHSLRSKESVVPFNSGIGTFTKLNYRVFKYVEAEEERTCG